MKVLIRFYIKKARMVRNLILLILLSIIIVSCSTEKIAFLSEIGSKQNLIDFQKDISQNINKVNYMSELSDIVSYIPEFKNEKINKAIEKTKFDITDYIYAIREYNRVGEERSFDRLQSDFKKLTKFKNLMSEDEYEVLMRYLVKIKSNISLLKSNQK